MGDVPGKMSGRAKKSSGKIGDHSRRNSTDAESKAPSICI